MSRQIYSIKSSPRGSFACDCRGNNDRSCGDDVGRGYGGNEPDNVLFADPNEDDAMPHNCMLLEAMGSSFQMNTFEGPINPTEDTDCKLYLAAIKEAKQQAQDHREAGYCTA